MPTYEFGCTHCGDDFVAMRRIAERNDPMACPGCGGEAVRVVLTAPTMWSMSSSDRKAHATNEKARHAPKSSEEYKATHKHGPGCGCCGGGLSKATVTAPDGKKAFPTKRPWMISH